MSTPIWITSSGTLGDYPALIPMSFQLQATPVGVTYSLISGALPTGLSLHSTGLISGTPAFVTHQTTNTFIVRITDPTSGDVADRTFNISIAVSTTRWITATGSIGVFPALIPMNFQLQALPLGVTYSLISGSLPPGLSLRSDGLISGTPSIVIKDTTSTFVIRATYPAVQTVSDRTFSIRITGTAVPTFIIPSGTSLVETYDSIWQEIPIPYNNPIASNPVYIRVTQGELPPGLEINEYGLIRGYPEPPVILVDIDDTFTKAVATSASTNYVTVISTYHMFPNRIIRFAGIPFGGLEVGTTYYVKNVINATQLLITKTPGGDAVALTTATGLMSANLPASQVGEPTKYQYNFILQLRSTLQDATTVYNTASYSITVINQNLAPPQGPGLPLDTRTPTIYNTRPATYIQIGDVNHGYYVLPPNDEVAVPGMAYSPAEQAYIGQFINDDFMAFKILGHDFDGSNLIYVFSGLPSWLTGDSATGWIYGTPTATLPNYINEYSFGVLVKKDISTKLSAAITAPNSTTDIVVSTTDGFLAASITQPQLIQIGQEIIRYTGITVTSFTGITRGVNSSVAAPHPTGATVKPYGSSYISSTTFNFSFEVNNNVNGIIIWNTDSDLGIINNATNSYKYVSAACDLPLIYELTSGALPPNLILTSEGLIQGIVSYQPSTTYKEQNTTETFTFTVKAYNPTILDNLSQPLVSSERTFTLTVDQYYGMPTDNLYIKCTPSIADRNILGTLLGNWGSTTQVTATDSATNRLTVLTTQYMSVGAPVIFTGTTFGGVVAGKTYYIKYIISSTQIQISTERGDDAVTLTTATGYMDITMLPIFPHYEYIFRPTDPNFGIASSVVYAHAYGIYSNTINEYIQAVQKNHYWRDITLGQLKTAVAKDETGEVIYEVVYSEVIDNLEKYDPNYDYRYSTSVSEEIYWPRYIDLNLGPWYTSSTEIYTSYIFDAGTVLITNLRSYDIEVQTGPNILTQQGTPTFYTSLTPGYARILYPNSLENMRKRVSQELGADYNYRLLPLWMTSQQSDGNTLGFTPAWVICYTKPAVKFEFAATGTYDSTQTPPNSIRVVSTDGLEIGGTVEFSGNIFGSIKPNTKYYIVSVDQANKTIQISIYKNGAVLLLTSTTDKTTTLTQAIIDADSTANIRVTSTQNFSSRGYLRIEEEIIQYTGVTPNTFTGITRGAANSVATGHPPGSTVTSAILEIAVFDPVSYAEIIKNNIINNWPYTLNLINFEIDRFTVDKKLTYNYDSQLVPGTWTSYPGATPVPDPLDSENFYVLFPQKTILPTATQYNL